MDIFFLILSVLYNKLSYADHYVHAAFLFLLLFFPHQRKQNCFFFTFMLLILLYIYMKFLLHEVAKRRKKKSLDADFFTLFTPFTKKENLRNEDKS